MEIQIKSSYQCIECKRPAVAHGAYPADESPYCARHWRRHPDALRYIVGILAAVIAGFVLVVVLS